MYSTRSVWMLFFFKQNTAYDMRISYWSSDVCSSDLSVCAARYRFERRAVARGGRGAGPGTGRAARWRGVAGYPRPGQATAVDLLRRLQRLIRMSPQKAVGMQPRPTAGRSEEHTSELQSLMRISYAVFCLNKKK